MGNKSNNSKYLLNYKNKNIENTGFFYAIATTLLSYKLVDLISYNKIKYWCSSVACLLIVNVTTE